MGWIYLILAGVCEVIGVTGINQVNKRRSIPAFLLLAGGFSCSLFFLTQAMNTIAMGTAYAIWTGIGTVGSAVVGMVYYGESAEWRRLLFIAMILSATIGLKLIS